MEVRLDGKSAVITGGSKGLGLAIAQEYALAHGGRVELVDRMGGARGAHFRVWLPVAIGAGPARTAATKPADKPKEVKPADKDETGVIIRYDDIAGDGRPRTALVERAVGRGRDRIHRCRE